MVRRFRRAAALVELAGAAWSSGLAVDLPRGLATRSRWPGHPPSAQARRASRL